MMEYKPTYTKEDADELVKWFETHTYDTELDMGGGLYIADLRNTLPQMLHIVRTKYDNRTFSGQIHLTFKIREELIKQNKVKS